MRAFRRVERLMGNAFELCVVSSNQNLANHLLQLGVKEIQRIESLLTEFNDNSDTSRINQFASKHPVQIASETLNLIQRCKDISTLTSGCFDITIGPLKKLYNFDRNEFNFPSHRKIKAALDNVGFTNIVLNKKASTVSFKKNTRISFAAIGKGYASDKVKALWHAQGLESGYINASGDLSAFGQKPNGGPWQLGIANPDNRDEILVFLPADNIAMATSGDYEKYFIRNGKRYSHNLNPLTGKPLTGTKSVSIISPSAELSDALATAVYVMGGKQGIELVNQLPQTHAIIIDDNNEMFLSKELSYENTTH